MAFDITTPGPDALGGRDDSVTGFQLNELPVRGRIARLGPVIDEILSAHDYPASVAALVGEAVLIALLIGDSMKFEGRLIIQASGGNTNPGGIEGKGAVSFVVADYMPGEGVRGFAKFDADKVAKIESAHGPRPGAQALLGQGHFAMTIDQGSDMAPYQGVVALDGPSLGACAEHYFHQSEQLHTRLKLAVGEHYVGDDGRVWRAGGALIQRLAGDDVRASEDEDFEHVRALFRLNQLHPQPGPALLHLPAQPGGHANFGPGSPADAQRSLSLPVAFGRQHVHERISGDIVCLTGRAEDRGDGTVQDEEVERKVAREQMQVPGAVDLGRHHAGEARPTLLQKNAVVQHPGRVDDTPQGRQRPLYMRQNTGNVFVARDVSLRNFDGDACFAKLAENRLRGFCWGTAPQQHEVPGALPAQPAGCGQAQAAETASDQIGCIRIDKSSLSSITRAACRPLSHHNLADMFGLGHEAKGSANLLYREEMAR